MYVYNHAIKKFLTQKISICVKSCLPKLAAQTKPSAAEELSDRKLKIKIGETANFFTASLTTAAFAD